MEVLRRDGVEKPSKKDIQRVVNSVDASLRAKSLPKTMDIHVAGPYLFQTDASGSRSGVSRRVRDPDGPGKAVLRH